MSRLIIKNIPSYITPTRLKDHFSQKDAPSGTVTDVKVALKPDGTPRRFAFVGFKTEDEAKKAQQWFDNTFIDSTRIHVSIAEKGAKDAPAPRPNKKTKLDEQDHPSRPATVKGNAPTTGVDNKSDDLEKFLHVMQPRTKKDRSWQNEAGPHPEPRPQVESASVPNPEETTSEDRVEEVDDLEWMKRRMAKGLQLADQLDERAFAQEDEGEAKPKNPSEESQKHSGEEDNDSDPHQIILKTGRLFIRNLSYSCLDSDLESLFTPFGSVNEVHVSFDPITKSSKGFAYVRFLDPQSALEAYKALDKTPFQGRLLHILPAVERQKPHVESEEGKLSIKSVKDKKRKDTANKEFNWGMLYMHSDAVASSIADRMNISKADILNPDEANLDGTSAAVKLALAETHIIQETKDYLESEGIDLSSFSTLTSSNLAIRQRRSDTCILVKNIPYGTTAAQIRELFEPHGELSRVLVPPAGTIAVVDFVHPDEAAKAFKAVAYRRMGASIIYLEKAPVGIFNAIPRERSEATGSTLVQKDASNSKTNNTSTDSTEPVQDNEEDAAPGSTLFVKNLSFATSAERLTQVFRHLPGFAFARIQTKIDPKRPNQRLSMGYGFVGFKSPESAKKALLSMQNFTLDGHSLTVKFSGRGTEEDAKAKENVSAKTTKMIVKNVPFEATKKDIRELFSAHGQLKSVRLPKRFDARSRGFAFLEFVTRHEAENAYAALRHTHLLGRHLVLEWASETEDIEQLRTKAGVGFGGGAELPGRKRKLELDDGDSGDEE